ncbi:MAG: DUF5915 domain-containing protein, partial [Actinomycetota bacterium]
VVCSVRPEAPDSVHLADWPSYDESLIDEELRTSMAAARRARTLGLQAREQAKIKVRQPLARVVIEGPTADAATRHAAIIAEELNVKAVAVGAPPNGWPAAEEGSLKVALDPEITRELRAEGIARELVRAVQNLRKKSGLAVSDRIALGVEGASDDLWTALEPHRAWIADEVLATDLGREAVDGDGSAEVRIEGAAIRISLKRR